MIIETIPALQKLSPEEKAILAEELWVAAAVSNHDEEEVKSAILEVLKVRGEGYEMNPMTATPWSELRGKIGLTN